MSEAKHTSEPWELHPDYPNQVRRPPSNDAYGLSACIADCSSGIWPDSKTVANAARIVACVNACKGINPEAVPDLLNACREALEIRSLAYQVDANPKLDILTRREIERKVDGIIERIEAAIAKAEGKDQ